MKQLLNLKNKRQKYFFIILAVIVFIAIIVGIICRVCYVAQLEHNEEIYRQLSSIIDGSEAIPENTLTVDGETEQAKVENKTLREVDFDILKETNEDIYAWITVDGTQVNYPILQNAEDNYYLKRCIDGKSGYPGCIYTNACHSQDFSSWNTVIYGHNMNNGSMFGGLKISNDWEKENEYIVIKIPDRILQYRVYAVTEFSDEYIPLAYDEGSETDRQQFLDTVVQNAQNGGYLREDMEVSSTDKLVTLSTCIRGKSNKRLLIIGVLE